MEMLEVQRYIDSQDFEGAIDHLDQLIRRPVESFRILVHFLLEPANRYSCPLDQQYRFLKVMKTRTEKTMENMENRLRVEVEKRYVRKYFASQTIDEFMTLGKKPKSVALKMLKQSVSHLKKSSDGTKYHVERIVKLGEIVWPKFVYRLEIFTMFRSFDDFRKIALREFLDENELKKTPYGKFLYGTFFVLNLAQNEVKLPQLVDIVEDDHLQGQ
eukprot:TRINITY_DN22528_c0_g1_i1.p1 TRINITY_DN22528_c0_g1~~TRINITY_DN22528_c0_g1_i1.p1  ORF type:complete len:215 (-),score=18.27 TRINITY_DN22528_c0_g1_i1:41-685(-)